VDTGQTMRKRVIRGDKSRRRHGTKGVRKAASGETLREKATINTRRNRVSEMPEPAKVRKKKQNETGDIKLLLVGGGAEDRGKKWSVLKCWKPPQDWGIVKRI